MTLSMLTVLVLLLGCGQEQGGTLVGVPDTTFFTPPAIIDATGALDVTRELNHFFASVPDSALIKLPAGARYRIEGTLDFRERHGLTIEGNGTVFFALTDGSDANPTPSFGRQWPRTRQHFLFVGGSEITIRDVTIVGANPDAGSAEGAYVVALEGQHGLKFMGVEGVKLERITVSDVYGDFLYLGGRGGGRITRDVHVTAAHFERSGRQGIAITAAEDVLIENSYVGEVARSIIDLEPNTAGGRAWNIVLRRNKFGPCRHLLLSAGGRGADVGEVELSENALQGMQLKVRAVAPEGTRRGPFRVVDNVSDTRLGTPVAALRFVRIDGVEVRGNVQPMVAARSMTGVSAMESCDVIVQENDFRNAVLQAEIEPYSCSAFS